MSKAIYRILIVDDEQAHREKIVELLTQGLELELEYHVQFDEAASVREAKAKLLHAPEGGFDLVILDWRMDDPNATSSAASNGAALLKWMHNPEFDFDTEAIMLTGHGSEQIQLGILSLGAYAYVSKPEVFHDAFAQQEDGSLGGLHLRAFLFHVRNCMVRRRAMWRKEQVLRVLHDLHRQLGEIHDHEQRLQAIVRCTQRINPFVAKATIRVRSGTDHQRVAIWLADEWRKEGVSVGAVLAVENGIAGRVFRTGQPYWCQNVREDSHFAMTWRNTKSELCVPVFGRERGDRQREAIAVINLESAEADAFNEEDARFFQMLAEVASLTIQDTTLLRGVFEMAADINSAVLSGGVSPSGSSEPYLKALAEVESEHLVPLFQTVLDKALSFTDADSGAVFLAYPDQNELRLVAERGMGNDAKVAMRSVPLDIERSISARVCRTGQTIMTTDSQRHEERPLWDQYAPFYDDTNARSFLCVPMLIGNETIGCIDIESRNELTFSPLEAQMIEACARMAATAIANLALVMSIKRMTEEEKRVELISLAAHEVLGPVHKVGLVIGGLKSQMQSSSAKMSKKTSLGVL